MSLNPDVQQRIESIIKSDDVVLFMKGNRNFPQCGFSATVIQILNSLIPEYTTFNVLADPDIRQGIKDFSEWPTIPQLYVRGEFIGGCDIIREAFDSGELRTMLGAEDLAPPNITVTAAAAAAIKEALSAESDEGDAIHLEVDATFQHTMNLGPATDQRITVEASGVTFSIDPMSARRLDGVTIDYVDSAGEAGFKIDNPNRPPEVVQLTAAELKAKLDSGEIAEFVDVRTPDERDKASIAGSRLLDDAYMQHLSNLDSDTAVAFYCHHGQRSLAAAEHFRDRGFRKLYNLSGGIDAWSSEVDSAVPRY